jgi:GT2 family glycosyltransferase
MISVITVSYRTLDYVEAMLRSLFAQERAEDLEVFVVINGDGSDPSALRAAFPSVRFVVSDRNLGFAGGNNLALGLASGEFAVLVNPDVTFTEPAVSAIVDRMRRDPDVGVGGISLKNPDGSQQGCVWRFPAVIDQFLILSKVPHLFPNLPPIRRYLMRGFDYARTQDVDQVMGAFFCVRREAVDRIGPLDDGFFMWYEEVDFCRRAHDAGWKTRYYADVVATHRKAASFDRVGTFKKQAMVRRSLRRYMRKHHGRAAWLLFVFLNPLFVALAAFASFVKPK